MKRSQEMHLELENLKNEIKTLQASGEIEEAHAKLGEMAQLKNAIEVQEAIENAEMDSTPKIAAPGAMVANETVAFNKAVLGRNLSEAENALVERVGEDGGYLVPVEQKTQIEELKRKLIPLKQFCNVIPVGTLSGSMPLEVEADDMLIDFGEMEELNQSTIKFGQTKWELKDKGDIIPISNTLLQDEKANLTNYVGRRFAKKAVRTENKDILDLLKTATKKSGTDYKAIISALNKELDPAIAADAIIITNQDGYDYLDTLEDKNGRPLLKDSLEVEGAKTFKGKLIIPMANQHLTSPTGGFGFFVGDMAGFVAFFDREAYEMAVSKEAGFTKNTTYMRVIERYDVKKVDSKAMVYVEIKPAAGA